MAVTRRVPNSGTIRVSPETGDPKWRPASLRGAIEAVNIRPLYPIGMGGACLAL
jgi:hypothetical protein